MNAKNFFTPVQVSALQQAILDAEKNTSGEIRLHVENHASQDIVKQAEKIFGKLGMHKTDERNGVLFFLAVKDRAFAIYGDKGINEKVPGDFWEKIKSTMQVHFSNGNFTEGLCEGMKMAGDELKHFFPLKEGDKNELTNQVSFK